MLNSNTSDNGIEKMLFTQSISKHVMSVTIAHAETLQHIRERL